MTTDSKFIFVLCVLGTIQLAAAANTTTNVSEELVGRWLLINESTLYRIPNLESYSSKSRTATNDPSLIASNYLKSRGVDLSKSNTIVAFNKWMGLLLVRAAPAEEEKVERIVDELNQTAPKIHLKARLFKASESEIAFLLKSGITVSRRKNKTKPVEEPENGGLHTSPVLVVAEVNTEIFTTDKMNFLLPRLKPEFGIEMLAEQEIVIATMTNEMRLEIPSENFRANLAPILQKDDLTVTLSSMANSPEFSSTRANVWDGQALLIVFPKTEDKKRLAIFITPTIVGPAGNRIHPNNELPPKASAIPPQD